VCSRRTCRFWGSGCAPGTTDTRACLGNQLRGVRASCATEDGLLHVCAWRRVALPGGPGTACCSCSGGGGGAPAGAGGTAPPGTSASTGIGAAAAAAAASASPTPPASAISPFPANAKSHYQVGMAVARGCTDGFFVFCFFSFFLGRCSKSH
jgi:hypothetical protein